MATVMLSFVLIGRLNFSWHCGSPRNITITPLEHHWNTTASTIPKYHWNSPGTPLEHCRTWPEHHHNTPRTPLEYHCVHNTGISLEQPWNTSGTLPEHGRKITVTPQNTTGISLPWQYWNNSRTSLKHCLNMAEHHRNTAGIQLHRQY